MEKIKINHTGPAYGIQSITPVSEHVIRIVFAGSIPAEWGDIGVYTAGDLQCANLPGYDTVYRDEGQTVYLSDDGSVYAPPELPGWESGAAAGAICPIGRGASGRRGVCQTPGDLAGL